ncbi:hypothetical protein CYY_004129 [Polysphondylium violaceum]|uniref:DUF2470 domain-containing protein n=1 Tax=Polysphondylium violaceum TaxID=133409 RepID=A0A8J4Q5X7_9MYCE|nr:hypothetical protein CYY_004129 [Polysphondylium violaceum]
MNSSILFTRSTTQKYFKSKLSTAANSSNSQYFSNNSIKSFLVKFKITTPSHSTNNTFYTCIGPKNNSNNTTPKTRNKITTTTTPTSNPLTPQINHHTCLTPKNASTQPFTYFRNFCSCTNTNESTLKTSNNDTNKSNNNNNSSINNTNSNNSNNSNNHNKSEQEKKSERKKKIIQQEASIYGNVGDMQFAEKKAGPSITTALTQSQFAKSLLLMRMTATLSSVNMLAKMTEESQTPVYGSLVNYALLDSVELVKPDASSPLTDYTVYNPIVPLRKTDPHVAHFKHFSKVSLVVYPLTPVGCPPSQYDLSCVNFSCRMKLLTDISEKERAKKAFFMRFPNSRKSVNDNDFDFYLLDIQDAYFKERNSNLSVIPIDSLKTAQADPVTITSREIIETSNAKYIDALRIIASEYGDVKLDTQVFMYFVDRYGFNCIGKKKQADEWLDIRIPFDTSFTSFNDCKEGLFATFQDILDKVNK